MLLTKVCTLGVAVGVLFIAGVSAVGCSGSDFSASAYGGDAGVSSGGSGAAGGRAGSSNAGAGRGGHAGTSPGGASAGGTGGEAGASEGGAAGGGEGGSGGTLGAAGAAGAADAGAGGEAGDCAVAWFPDGDGDGFGRSSGKVLACTPPTSGAWVNVGKDCNDDNKLVYPMAPSSSDKGYVLAGGGVSFDYDCSGVEEVDTGQLGAAPACAVLSCTGTGYQATSRTGPGVDPLCGSKALVKCVAGTLTCTAQPVVPPVSEGIRCH